MCDGGAVSGPAIAAYIAAGTAVAGAGLQYKSSQDQASAAAKAQLDETDRQGSIMRDNINLQNAQRQDAEQSRKQFQQETLPAFTRESLDKDQATEQTRLQSALTTAGNRALTPSTGDAASANSAVVSSAGPAAPTNNDQAFQSALADQMSYANAYGAEQTRAQAAIAALGRAQQLGGERLQKSGMGLTLNGAKLAAYNRAIAANGLYSNASNGLYQNAAESAANKGVGLALAGSTLSTIGNAGYSYASKGSAIPRATIVT